jgi:hypothetical protein
MDSAVFLAVLPQLSLALVIILVAAIYAARWSGPPHAN